MSVNSTLSIIASSDNMMLTLVNVLALLLQAALVKQAFKLEREIIATACKHKAPKPVS